MKWGTHSDVGLLLWGRRVLVGCAEAPCTGRAMGGTGRAAQGSHAEQGAGSAGERSLESGSRAQEGWDGWILWGLVGKAHAGGNVTERRLWAQDGG